jgi:hypothetical protein
VLAQRIARVHRLGQREVVNVVLLVSEGGFEERMEGTLDSKRALFAAANALVALRDASPFAAAEILFSAPDEGPAAAALAARRALASGARRKRDAADALVAAGMACEALHLYRDAMALACRALDDRGDPGEEPAALLLAVHAHLVPSGALDSAGAAALTRGGELARAFARLPDAPPQPIVAAIAADASTLVARAQAGLSQPA